MSVPLFFLSVKETQCRKRAAPVSIPMKLRHWTRSSLPGRRCPRQGDEEDEEDVSNSNEIAYRGPEMGTLSPTSVASSAGIRDPEAIPLELRLRAK